MICSKLSLSSVNCHIIFFHLLGEAKWYPIHTTFNSTRKQAIMSNLSLRFFISVSFIKIEQKSLNVSMKLFGFIISWNSCISNVSQTLNLHLVESKKDVLFYMIRQYKYIFLFCGGKNKNCWKWIQQNTWWDLKLWIHSVTFNVKFCRLCCMVYCLLLNVKSCW